MEWVYEFADWLVSLVKNLILAIWDFLTDIVISLVDLFLTALLAIIQLLPLPDFLKNGLQGLFSAVPSEVWFFASHFKLAECLAMFGAAFLFRLGRKAVTLFQW